MLGWYLSLRRAGWKQRVFGALVAAVVLSNLYSSWGNLHDSLAIARWVAWINIVGVVVLMPPALMVLIGGRVPRSFSRLPGSLNKTLPQIHADIAREHRARGRGKRRF